MSNYPDAEDVFTPVAGSDEMTEHAERHTAEEEAIIAIQKTLGTNPEGTSNTVVERLDEQDSRIDALKEPPVGQSNYRHGDYATPGYGFITAGNPGNFAVNSFDALGNKFISPKENDTFTYKLNGAEKSFQVTFVAATGTQTVMQGNIADASQEGDIISVEVEEIGFPAHEHPEYSETDHTHDPDDAKLDRGTTTYNDAREIQDAIEAMSASGGYDDSWIQPALDGKSDEPHTHDDLAAGDHNHDGDYATEDHNHDLVYQPKGDYATDDHTHDDLAAGDHTHDADDTKLDKGATTYLDAKAIEDDISGIEKSISDLSDNYDQIVIDLGEAGQDLTVELESYLKKGTASYADAAGIETDIDQEKQDRAEADTALSEEVAKKLDKGTSTYADAKEIQDAIEGIVVPDVGDFVTEDDLNTALSGKADEPHTHDDLAAGDHTHDEYLTDLTHDHDGTYQPVGDYATKTELSDGLAGKSDDGHTHDTTHDHEEYFLSGATVDEFGQPIPLPYATAKLLGDAVDTKADEDHTHEGFAADDHTHDAPEINTSQVTLAADAVAGFHDLEDGTEVLTQADVNVYLSEKTVFKGATWGDLAGRS